MKNTTLSVLVLVAGCGVASPDADTAELKKARHPRPHGAIVSTHLLDLVTDAELAGAWGLAFNPSGPAWISANQADQTVVYDQAGNLLLRVPMPSPTGQVFNPRAADSFSGDRFIIASETGQVIGWQPGGTAVRFADPSAAYTGIAFAETKGGPRLYLTDHANGRIQVLTDLYRPITLEGDFSEPGVECGSSPANIVNFLDRLFIAYSGKKGGYVNVYDLEGKLITRLISDLSSPWGMAFAPWRLKGQAVELLVADEGRILRYRVSFRGGVPVAYFGGPLDDIFIEGLRALEFFGDQLFFTASPGRFGKLVFAL
jgi:uncharacterized protein (TIGR03118 family)